jgi:hypothetical protein
MENICPDQVNRTCITVIDSDINSAFLRNPEPPDTGCTHGIDIILRVYYLEQEYCGIAVELHAPVIKNRCGAGREGGIFVLPGDKKTCTPLYGLY